MLADVPDLYVCSHPSGFNVPLPDGTDTSCVLGRCANVLLNDLPCLDSSDIQNYHRNVLCPVLLLFVFHAHVDILLIQIAQLWN